MNLGVIAQQNNSRAVEVAAEIDAALAEHDVGCQFDPTTAESLGRSADGKSLSTFESCALVVSIGGDGTFLFAARAAGETPILGINLGEVGFLNAVAPDNAVSTVREEIMSLQAGTHTSREAPRLTAVADDFASVPAVNELVVGGPRRGHGGGAQIEVSVNGSSYSAGHADGVMIATPMGSTAYNLSEGGPIVHPEIDGLVINEMCAVDGMPPLVVDEDSRIEVTVRHTDHAVVVSDGRQPSTLDTPASLTVSRAETPVRIAGPATDFFEALDKLS